jgi:hypothetical protein
MKGRQRETHDHDQQEQAMPDLQAPAERLKEVHHAML